ncbi:JmjC domain-containing protein [Actinokineospora sp. 24-640]
MGQALARLAPDHDRLCEHWEQKPLVSRNCGRFDEVFSLETLEQTLMNPALVSSTVRMMRRGDELDPALFSAGRERSTPGAERRLDPAAVLGLVADGATVVLEEIQSHCPTVAAFTDQIRAETGWQTYTTAFLTPPGSFGAPLHYDMTSVFVRQLHGSKRWRIGRPTEPWPVTAWHTGMSLNFDEILDITLDEGDCLYLPRGFHHIAEATEEPSLHLTIGMIPVTWAGVLHRLLDSGAPTELRSALPLGFHTMSDDELHQSLTEQIDRACQHLRHIDRPVVAGLVRRMYFPTEVPNPSKPGDLRVALTSVDQLPASNT